MNLSLEDVDNILFSKKIVAAQASWSSGQRETIARIKIPLLINDEIYPQLYLQGDATIHCEIQRGGLSLVLNGKPIERMNIFPQKPHANSLSKHIPKSFRGLVLGADIHRYYSWKDNRRWPRLPTDNMDFGKPVDQKINDYLGAMP